MENSIRRIAYELYKIDWVTDHLNNTRLKSYIEYAKSEESEEMSYEEYFNEFGYGGEVYVCYDEFMDYEYHSKEYMKYLIIDDELYEKYINDIMSLEGE